ncbi:MAG: VWA domain-containing protein [Candidatus Poribacteria bacterium]
MARRRRMGLPAPLWIGRESRTRRKRRSPIILSLALHSLLAALAVLFLSTANTRHERIDTVMAVQFLAPLPSIPEPKRPLKRLARKAQADPEAPQWQQMASPAPQTIELDASTIMHPADMHTPDALTQVDIVTTAAKARTDDRPLSSVRGLSTRPTPGQGVVTGIQRPEGQEGTHLSDSSGAAEVGLPGGLETGAGRRQSEALPRRMVSPFHNALATIGDSIASSNVSGVSDVLFVVDTSGSMADNIAAVAEHLFSLTDRLEEADIDYQLGVAAFRELDTGPKIELSGWTIDPQTMRTRMRALGVVGNERALDALVQTLQVTRFRPASDRVMVFVTDEPATTKWEASGATQEIRERVLAETTRDAIQVQVLGFDEKFQRDLASRSGGVFQVIPTSNRQRSQSPEPASPPLPQTALESEFRGIAGDMGRWAESTKDGMRDMDILLFIDVSGSMQGKLRAVMYGVSIFDSALGLGDQSAEYTLARFAIADGVTGSGVVGVNVSQPLADVVSIQRLLQYPAVGDEFLLDAMSESLPSPGRKGVPQASIIITDEPPSGETATGGEVAAAMRDSGMRFYAFLPWPPPTGDLPLDTIHKAVTASGGQVFQMPDAHYERQRNR